MAADRIRVGEADVMIAGGAESMSMVPMSGNKPSFNAHIFEKDENVGIAYGMGMTAEKVAAQWKVTREMQDQFALESHQKAIAAQKAGEFTDEMTPIEVVEKFPDLASDELAVEDPHGEPRRRPARRHLARGAGQAAPGVRRQGQRHRRQQLADVRRRRRADPGQSERALKQFDLTPLARFVSFAVKGVPPEIMGIGPIDAIPAALASAGLHCRRHRLDRAQRGLRRAGRWR